jgi:hypothetical protein
VVEALAHSDTSCIAEIGRIASLREVSARAHLE